MDDSVIMGIALSLCKCDLNVLLNLTAGLMSKFLYTLPEYSHLEYCTYLMILKILR